MTQFAKFLKTNPGDGGFDIAVNPLLVQSVEPGPETEDVDTGVKTQHSFVYTSDDGTPLRVRGSVDTVVTRLDEAKNYNLPSFKAQEAP